MDNINSKINDFLGNESNTNQEVCDLSSGVCFIKTPDGLIERRIIEKKLMVEDGRELLREETPISHSNRKFLI